MKLDKIYNLLVEIIEDDMNFQKVLKLKEQLEQAIREETCYKTTSKTRVNGIKKVAARNNIRPVLTGYTIINYNGYEYKVVTDSYHLIAIKEENIPLKLVTTDDTLADKIGKANCIYGNYPNITHLLDFNKNDYQTISLNLNDIAQFYKLHNKKAKDELYKINGQSYNIKYLKNLVDVLGNKITIYQSDDYKPLYIINNKNEIGLVLPVKKY